MSVKQNFEVSKNVVVLRFSIYGVDGFKTVCAEGVENTKRISSAINEIARGIRQMYPKQDLFGADASYPDPDQIKFLREGRDLLESICRVASDYDNEMYNGVVVTNPTENVLSTKDFVASADHFYQHNTKLFLDSLDTIRQNQEKVIREEQQVVNADDKYLPAIPTLYQFTGGFFGDKPQYLVLSTKLFDNAPEDDPSFPVRTMLYAELANIKNQLLTSYLRHEGNDGEKAKQAAKRVGRQLARIDQFIDSIPQVQAKYFTSLLSFGTEEPLLVARKTSSRATNTEITVERITQLLTAEAQKTIQELIGSALIQVV